MFSKMLRIISHLPGSAKAKIQDALNRVDKDTPIIVRHGESFTVNTNRPPDEVIGDRQVWYINSDNTTVDKPADPKAFDTFAEYQAEGGKLTQYGDENTIGWFDEKRW